MFDQVKHDSSLYFSFSSQLMCIIELVLLGKNINNNAIWLNISIHFSNNNESLCLCLSYYAKEDVVSKVHYYTTEGLQGNALRKLEVEIN